MIFNFLVASVLALCRLAAAAQLTQVSDFGENSSGAKMFIYVPDNLATSPAIIVAIHYCSGTAQAYYSGSPYARLAETHGFIVIYPESPYSGTCWDVSSDATLTHDGGANSNSIANMVTYTIGQYGADTSRVFVTGSSSGAMMTVSFFSFPFSLHSLLSQPPLESVGGNWEPEIHIQIEINQRHHHDPLP
jgi:acetylxylan esterase